MITRLFLIVLSIVLSGQSLEGCVEETSIEKAHGIEVVYEELIATVETKKQSRKIACKQPIASHIDGRKLVHPPNEKTISPAPLYVHYRSLRI